MFVNPNKIWIVYMSIFLYFNTSIAQHVYTSIRIHVYTSIRLYTLHLRCFFTFTFIYPSISVSDFDLTFHPLVVIFDFYSAKVSQAGNTANTGTSPIGGKLFMTLRNQRLRFPENFYRPIICLRVPLTPTMLPCT